MSITGRLFPDAAAAGSARVSCSRLNRLRAALEVER